MIINQTGRLIMIILIRTRSLNKKNLDKLEKLFNTNYYIAKSGRPFSDFNQLCILQVKNGVTLGETYLNDKRCRDERDQKETMNNAQPRFFTIMGDGGTDTSNKDLEIIDDTIHP